MMKEEDAAVAANVSKIKHKIMVMRGKGGVEKTTVSANLAFALAMSGLDVGLMDADSDVDWGELDYMIVDLPPGTGDEPLSIVQLMKEVDGSIIVTTPQDLALLDSSKAVARDRRAS